MNNLQLMADIANKAREILGSDDTKSVVSKGMKVSLCVDFISAEIYRYEKKHPDGFTLQLLDGKNPADGFSVAFEETQNSFGLVGLEKVVKHALEHNAVVGGWYDSESQLYYYDSVIIVDDLKTAMRIGKAQNQIAIYDLKKGKEIRL